MVEQAGEFQRFRKRFLSSPIQFFKILGGLIGALLEKLFTASSDRLSRAFEERLNLAVSGVNECKYCSHLHMRYALEAGVAPEEAAALLGGEMEGVPADEARAIAFARYWADMGGDDNTDRYEALEEAYGKGKAAAILNAVRIVHAGNMCSNTVEAFRAKAEVDHRCRFFVAYVLSYPLASAIRSLGGYREGQ